jgi:hypothetical protein
VSINHQPVLSDTLINQELLSHIYLHIVRIIRFDLLIELLRLMNHVELLLRYHLFVLSHRLLPVFLQLIKLELPSDSVSFNFQLNFLSQILWILERI